MWDNRYNTEEYVYGTDANDFLRENAASLPKGKVLCLAAGEGRNAVFLAELGYEVTAVDSSSVGLEKARILAEQRGVRLHTVLADLAEFDLGEGQWDGITSIFCHLPPALRSSLYERLPRSLRPGGVFLLEGYTPQQLANKTGGPPVVELMFTTSIIREELSSLQTDLLQEVRREIHEGSGHHGPSDVLQYIGRKV